ncbi:MAG: restriction endonuclease subunit S [Proteobacteria bacterium]|nr:restriction endonuclease subunit S [Pseudomonadota bacterium]
MSAIDGWTRKFPGHWGTKPLKAVASYMVSNVDKVPADNELPVRLCNYTDVYNNEFISTAMDLMRTTATATEIEKFRLLKNDVVITKDSESWDDIAIPSLIVDTADDLLCGYHLAILRPKPEEINGRFLFRCLQSKSIRLQLELSSTGVTRFGLPKGEIGKMLLPVTSLSAQQRIANYLDRETSQIDTLIKEKKRMLALLEEKRAVLISQATTRGLNPDASLKPSGYSWLGDIPAHWKVKRSKQVLKERDERSLTGDEELLTVSHITGVTKRSEKQVYMFEAETNEGYKRCSSGNLVINTLWAWMGAMGIAWEAGIVSPAYHVYELSSELLPGYVDALVRMPVFAKEVTRFSKGVWSSRLRLYPEGLYEVRLPVPPLEEQQQIIDAIASERQQTAEMETALNKSIGLLKERRSALITAAVTGQIEPEAMNP